MTRRDHFWIFTLLVGGSALAFMLIALQLGIGWSIVYALGAMSLSFGALSALNRWLISARMSAKNDSDERTIETNRALFWHRIIWFGFVVVPYFVGARVLFGLTLDEAAAALPAFLANAFTQLFYVLLPSSCVRGRVKTQNQWRNSELGPP